MLDRRAAYRTYVLWNALKKQKKFGKNVGKNRRTKNTLCIWKRPYRNTS